MPLAELQILQYNRIIIIIIIIIIVVFNLIPPKRVWKQILFSMAIEKVELMQDVFPNPCDWEHQYWKQTKK